MMNGGRGSSSHDFKFAEVITVRRSDSVIILKLSKTEEVEEKVGGGASAVEARRRSVFAVSASRKSLAVKVGVSVCREDRPRSPEMDDQSRLGSLVFSRDELHVHHVSEI